MKAVLKTELKFNKTLTLISLICCVFGIGLAFAGELCLPFTASLLAVLYLYDSRSQRRLSLLVSVGIVTVNTAATLFLGGYSSILAIESVVLALIISLCYQKSQSKTEAVLYATLTATVFLVLSFLAIPIISERVFSFDVVKSFYIEVYNTLKQVFVDTFMEFYNSLGDEVAAIAITAADIEETFERAAYMLISVIVIFGFAIAGITFKLFSTLVKRLDSDVKSIIAWRFSMPQLYAYFFMVLVIVNLFVSNDTSVLALAVANLYNIFLYVYAYIGVRLVYEHFASRHNRFFVLTAIAIILLLVSSFAVQLLAMIGVFYSLYRNKIQRIGGH